MIIWAEINEIHNRNINKIIVGSLKRSTKLTKPYLNWPRKTKKTTEHSNYWNQKWKKGNHHQSFRNKKEPMNN